jgi:hypothetical protein
MPPRHSAMLQLLEEVGARIGEEIILKLKVSNLRGRCYI